MLKVLRGLLSPRWILMWISVLSFALASPALGQIGCGRGKTRDPKICKGKQRDVRGCCKIPKRRKRRGKAKRAVKAQVKAKTCSPGEVRTAETNNKCCYPGQYWSKRKRKCQGEPVCPEELGMVNVGERCGCPEGKEINQYTEGHCCWEGQEWVRGRWCVGEMTQGARAVYEREARERADREAREARERAEREAREARERAERERARRAVFTWIKIPSGSFNMGSNDGESYKKPVHRVSVSAFEMSETEVTVAQYRKCVEAGVCTEPSTGSDHCTWGKSGKDDHPINCVDWSQARTFSRWVGGDLPTEAQWEYAARGGKDFKYAGSDDPDDVAWFDSNSDSSTHPVKKKRANGYGLYDMSGNVWEWTLDEWHGSYSGAPSSGDQPWGGVPACSQRCDRGSSWRVNRGGSWTYVARYLRVARRYRSAPGSRGYDLGFRVRRTLP